VDLVDRQDLPEILQEVKVVVHLPQLDPTQQLLLHKKGEAEKHPLTETRLLVCRWLVDRVERLHFSGEGLRLEEQLHLRVNPTQVVVALAGEEMKLTQVLVVDQVPI
jgi:hypothetical protein